MPPILTPAQTEQTKGPIRRFRQECRAYRYFCRYQNATGSVPDCLGWVTLANDQIEHISTKFKIWPRAESRKFPMHGLLIEYFPNAQILSTANITKELAESAMRGMCRVHQCYVLHNDVAEQNCLVVAENRVVWIDFADSETPYTPENCAVRPCTRRDYWGEFQETWDFIYLITVSTISDTIQALRINSLMLYL